MLTREPQHCLAAGYIVIGRHGSRLRTQLLVLRGDAPPPSRQAFLQAFL